MKCRILRQHQKDMANKIKIWDIAAYNVDEIDANGIYVMKWTSVSYTSQDNGELLCDELYYEITYVKYIYVCNLWDDMYHQGEIRFSHRDKNVPGNSKTGVIFARNR